MITNGIFFQLGGFSGGSSGFYGGNIGYILSNLEQLGFFAYLLPFLLIFAIVYGILSKVKIFGDNKSVDTVISFAVGLMALQFGIVSNFFAGIFPRLGIGLSIILVILILTGLFRGGEESSWTNYVLLGVGIIVAIVILIQSAGGFGFYSSYWWYDNWSSMLAILIVGVGVVVVIISSGKNSEENKGIKSNGYYNLR